MEMVWRHVRRCKTQRHPGLTTPYVQAKSCQMTVRYIVDGTHMAWATNISIVLTPDNPQQLLLLVIDSYVEPWLQLVNLCVKNRISDSCTECHSIAQHGIGDTSERHCIQCHRKRRDLSASFLHCDQQQLLLGGVAN